MKQKVNDRNGFTLVELVVVIILLSVLSVYAASRYIGSSNFSAIAAQEQAISIIRQVQLGRMQSNIGTANTLSSEYRLSVTSDCLGALASCSSTDDSRSNNLVLPDDVHFEPSMTIDFDLLGEPENFDDLADATSGVIQISIESAIQSRSICINRVGYVYGC